jgi:CBS domain-containing protein
MILMMVWALHDRLAHAIKEEMRMAQSIRDVMSANPITMPVASTVSEAARTMREANIGDIIVLEGDQLYGIVTDRDIVVRTIAEGRDPETATLGDICSREMTTLSPTDIVEDAVRLMRDKAIRRVPVIENGTPIGIVSLGDLAVSQDLHSTLGHISAAPPNV